MADLENDNFVVDVANKDRRCRDSVLMLKNVFAAIEVVELREVVLEVVVLFELSVEQSLVEVDELKKVEESKVVVVLIAVVVGRRMVEVLEVVVDVVEIEGQLVVEVVEIVERLVVEVVEIEERLVVEVVEIDERKDLVVTKLVLMVVLVVLLESLLVTEDLAV